MNGLKVIFYDLKSLNFCKFCRIDSRFIIFCQFNNQNSLGFMADCPDGKLSPTSFMQVKSIYFFENLKKIYNKAMIKTIIIQIYSKCFPNGNANEFCDHVFRTFDSDKNGFIDFKVFFF